MHPKRLRAAGYRRVSMKEQVDGFSLDAQETNIKQYVQAQGWEFVEMYTEAGISAKKDSHRPALERMLFDAQTHQFDVIVVDKVDRFYRHLRGLLGALDQLNAWNVSFVSVQERLDFTTAWGKLTLTVLGTLAEIYIDNLRQETKKGKLQRARDGYWNGNIPYGYCRGLCSACKEPNGAGYCPDFGSADKTDGKTLIAHPVESRVVRLVYDWYLTGGVSDGVISERLQQYPLDARGLLARTRGIPGQKASGPIQRDTVRHLLTNLFYTGVVPYRGENLNAPQQCFAGKHPALVSAEEFERVREIRRLLHKSPRTQRSVPSRIYPLSGILRCGQCGRAMRGSSGPRGTFYYRDATQIERSGGCPQRFVRAERIEARVAGWLKRVLGEVREEVVPREHLEQLRERFVRVRQLYIAGQVDQAFYESEREKYERWIPPLSKNNTNARMTSCDEMREQLNAWESLSNVQKRRLLRSAAEAVYITGSDLVAIKPSISLLPFTQSLFQTSVGRCGPDGDRNRGA